MWGVTQSDFILTQKIVKDLMLLIALKISTHNTEIQNISYKVMYQMRNAFNVQTEFN